MPPTPIPLKEVDCATEPIQIDGSTESDSGSSVQYDELGLLQTDKKNFRHLCRKKCMAK